MSARNMMASWAVSTAASMCAVLASAVEGPVPVRFSLDKPSRVTLVIEDAATGRRVRNLVMDEPFPHGENTVRWDAMDDHLQTNVRVHGGYDVSGSIVAPGEYVVRGIAHDEVSLKWLFCPYMPNNPIRTANRQGQWLSDHAPPCSLAWIGGKSGEIVAGAAIAEGAHSLVWLKPDGRKIVGQTNIGATYCGPAKLCFPKGAASAYACYGLGASINGEIVVVGISPERKTVQLYRRDKGVLWPREEGSWTRYDTRRTLCSLAVYSRLAAVGLPYPGEIRLLDLGEGKKDGAKETGTIKLADTRGLAFGDDGRLYVAIADRIIRSRAPMVSGDAVSVPSPDGFETFAAGLDDPRDVIVEGGRLFASIRGKSHQVWEFDARGKLLRKYGKAGVPSCGPYDERRMNNPQGLMLTPSGELWVAEEDFHPKRISVWDAGSIGGKPGAFLRAYYGPTQYGGGGKIDPEDRTRFYYYGLEMKLDWAKCDAKVANVYFRTDGDWRFRRQPPCDVVYLDGRRYMCDTFDAEPVNGPSVVTVCRYDDDGVARPVAMAGQLAPPFLPPFFDSAMTNLLTKEQYVGAINHRMRRFVHTVFAWSDVDGDGRIGENEISLAEGMASGINRIRGTLDFVLGDGKLLKAKKFTQDGIPVYDVRDTQTVGAGVPAGQTQVVCGRGGGYARLGTWAFETAKEYGVDWSKWAGGIVSGKTVDGRFWRYPYTFRGLHSTGLYPYRPPHHGELVGGTKLIGETLDLGPDKVETFFLNANSGQIYLMSVDGLFVASLFRHGWFCDKWGDTVLKRGDDVSRRSSDGEGFYQTVTRTRDGKIYLQALNHTSSLIEVVGLDSLRRLEPFRISVTKEHTDAALRLESDAEAMRQQSAGKKSLAVACGGTVSADGDDSDWDDAEFAVIDMQTEAALKIARNPEGKTRVFAAWRTSYRDLAANAGAEPWFNMFKTGGALDLHVATSPDGKSDAKRLLVSEIGGKAKAILYEPKSVKKGSSASVSSPNRTVKFDYVGDVSEDVKYAKGVLKNRAARTTKAYSEEDMNFRWRSCALYFHELEIDPELLGIAVGNAKNLRGDIGFLLGDSSRTLRRTYWHNKGTAHLYDAPEEAILHPELWGDFVLSRPKRPGADRNVHVLRSRTCGCWRIDTAKADAGRACCGIGWSGAGDLPQRAVGSKGYVVFRYDPKSWSETDTRMHMLPPFSLVNENLFTDRKNGDGFMYSTTDGKRIEALVLDARGRDNGFKWGSGGALVTRPEALWRIEVSDTMPHRITCVMPFAGDHVRLAVEQEGKKEILVAFGRADAECAIVVQFDVVGSFTLILEQDKFVKGHDAKTDGRAGGPAMQAIFFD